MFISLHTWILYRKSGQNRISESPQSSQSIEVDQQMKTSHPEVPGIDENLFNKMSLDIFVLVVYILCCLNYIKVLN